MLICILFSLPHFTFSLICTSTLSFLDLITILPAPQSQLSVFNSSNVETPDGQLAIGEYVTFHLAVSLPAGTTPHPTATVSVSTATGLLAIINASVVSISSNMDASNFAAVLSDTNHDSFSDSVALSFDSIVCHPNSSSANQVVFEIVAFVPVSILNAGEVSLLVNSQFSWQNGTSTLKQSSGSVSFVVVTPMLSWTITKNATSGDAGDVVAYSITVQHADASSAVAYNVNVYAQLAPYFNLLASTVASSHASVTLTPSATLGNGLIYLPVLPLGDSVTVTFSVYLDTSVRSVSVISNLMGANYSSSPADGLALYRTIISLSYLLFFDER